MKRSTWLGCGLIALVAFCTLHSRTVLVTEDRRSELFAQAAADTATGNQKNGTAKENATPLMARKGSVDRRGLPVAKEMADLPKLIDKDVIVTYFGPDNALQWESTTKCFRAGRTICLEGVADPERTKERPNVVLKDGTRVRVIYEGEGDWPDDVKGKRIVASGRLYRSQHKFEPGTFILPGVHGQSYSLVLDMWDAAKP